MKIKIKKQYCHWILESWGGGGGGWLQDTMQVGNFMDNLSAVVQIATAK